MKPRFNGRRPKVIALEHLGAWRELLGEHAVGRECRAWLYGPETVWFYLIPQGMEDQMAEYISWLDSLRLGPQIYPLYGKDILEAIAKSKRARRYIDYLRSRGAKIRFFDAKQQHFDFAQNHLRLRSWRSGVTSCPPTQRYLTDKVESRRLLTAQGLQRDLLPWRAVRYAGRTVEAIADDVLNAIDEVWADVRTRDLLDVVDCVLLKHPSLASSAGIMRVSSHEDIISFLKEYWEHQCPELLIEAGVTDHKAVSLQTYLGPVSDQVLGSSEQRIQQDGVNFKYLGNMMGHQMQVVEMPTYAQMLKTASEFNTPLRELGVRGYVVYDYLVDAHGRVWFLEVNLRVTATVYLRSFLDQITRAYQGIPFVGIIRNIDIPPGGARTFAGIRRRLEGILHNGMRGVMVCMIETLQSSSPQLCLVVTDRTTIEAETTLELAIRRLQNPIQLVEEEVRARAMNRDSVLITH